MSPDQHLIANAYDEDEVTYDIRGNTICLIVKDNLKRKYFPSLQGISSLDILRLLGFCVKRQLLGDHQVPSQMGEVGGTIEDKMREPSMSEANQYSHISCRGYLQYNIYTC